MFLEVFLPAFCVFVLAHWVSKPDNPGFLTHWNPAIYALAIAAFLRSPWGEYNLPKSQHFRRQVVVRIGKKWAKVQAGLLR